MPPVLADQKYCTTGIGLQYAVQRSTRNEGRQTYRSSKAIGIGVCNTCGLFIIIQELTHARDSKCLFKRT